jgi:hypothetical protein
MKRTLPLLGLVWLAAFSGCQTNDPTTSGSSVPTTPTNPIVETFAGTVQAKSKDVKQFTIALSGGTLAVTLTSANPSIQMSLGVGTWDGTNCNVLQGGTLLATPSSAPQIQGQVNLGNYCVIVSDAMTGVQTGAVTYSVTVSHY